MFFPPSGQPYHPALWREGRRNLAAPQPRTSVVRNRDAAGAISTRQFVSRKGCAIGAASEGFDCAMRGPVAGKDRIRTAHRPPTWVETAVDRLAKGVTAVTGDSKVL